MSRLSMMNDYVAHLAWRYLKGECSVNLSIKICTSTLPVTGDVREAYLFIYEIAYRDGYAKSNLANCMSESTYKIKKKIIRDTLTEILEGENEKS